MELTAEEERKLHEKVGELETGRRKPRDPAQVIEQMLKVVPEIGAPALRGHLELLGRRALFTAPEARGSVWRLLSEILISDLGDPTPAWRADGWQWRVGRIMRGEE